MRLTSDFGDAALASQRRYQPIVFAGVDAGDAGLHHHGSQGPIHPATGLQQGGEEASRQEAWDAQLDVTGWPGQEPITVAVAVSALLIRALMAIGTEGSCRLGFDQGLQALAHQFRDQIAGSATAKLLLQLSGGRMRNGHGLVSQVGGCTQTRVTDRPGHCPAGDLSSEPSAPE